MFIYEYSVYLYNCIFEGSNVAGCVGMVGSISLNKKKKTCISHAFSKLIVMPEKLVIKFVWPN